MTSSPMEVLSTTQWRAMQANHEHRVDALTSDAVERRNHGDRHPVWDFMYSYYPIKPGQLRKWYPGAGRALVVPSANNPDTSAEHQTVPPVDQPVAPPGKLPQFKGFFNASVQDGQHVWMLNTQKVWNKRGQGIAYIYRLLKLTMNRPAQLGCFGLHEWAMVYKDTPRHPEPLRLGAEQTNHVVENARIKCTHYDAFRFFTEAAVPLNANQPTRETQPNFEQPGCLHASMDLYKWAAKLGPLVPGELWLRTFELACDVRRLDMEASPYDLSEWGFEPVKIETPAGRAEYVRRQQELMERGQALRSELIGELDRAFPQLADGATAGRRGK